MLVVARYYAFQDAACLGCWWHSTRPEWKAFTQMSMEEVARGKEMALRFLAERNGAELKFQLGGKRLVGGGDDHARDSAADAVGERGV